MRKDFEQLDPNYVVTFEYTTDNLIRLVDELSSKGFSVLTRPGNDPNTLYAYTRVENGELHPHTKGSDDMTKLTDAEMLYRVCDPLKFVRSITPVDDNQTRHELNSLVNNLILKSFSLPSDKDLIRLSELTKSPRVCLHFAFFKTYIHWLSAITAIGIFFRYFFKSTPSSEFDILFTICLQVWALLFTATWSFHTQTKFSSRLGRVNNYFSSTGMKFSSPNTVLRRKFCFIPVSILFSVVLLIFQFFCFFVEIFISQFYQGSHKTLLLQMPLVLGVTFVPFLINVYNKKFVDKLVEWENGPNPNKSKIEKNLVLTFLTSYVPLFTTLFFYLPMGYRLTLEWNQLIIEICAMYNIPVQTTDFIIDVQRYRNQFYFFTVTNNIVGLVLEYIIPFLKDNFFSHIRKIKKQGSTETELELVIKANYPGELQLWKTINYFNKTAFGQFNVDDNYKKVVVQFGFITMFSTIWPLAPFFWLLFDYIIFKIDLWKAFKGCKPSSNPNYIATNRDNSTTTQVSADPWNGMLEFLTWLGTIISPVLILMYRYSYFPGVGVQWESEKEDLWYKNPPIRVSWTTVLLGAIISEHVTMFAFRFLKHLFSASTEESVYEVVPTTTIQEQAKSIFDEMLEETVKLMNTISKSEVRNSAISEVSKKQKKSQ